MESSSKEIKKYRIFPSVRFLVFILLFVGCFTRQAGNNILNFSIACMVNSSSYLDADTTEPTDNSTGCRSKVQAQHDDFAGTYDWDRDTQSNVLAALSWGSMIFIFCGGWICDRFGVKKLYVVVIGLLAITSFIIPVVAAQSWVGLFVLRFIQGLSMVAGWPVVMVVSNEWFPVKEIGLMQSMSTSGSQLGAFVAMMVSGAFCNSVGWEPIFYLFGGLATITSVCWLVLFYEKVADVPFMSAEEKAYISQTRKLPKTGSGPISIPWKSFFTSGPVWAIVVMNFCNVYIFYFVGQFSPTYYKEVIGIDPSSSGIYAALPFLAQLVGRNVAGLAITGADGRIPKSIFIRIAALVSGFLPPACLLISTAFDCHQPAAVVGLFTLSYFFYGWIIGSFVLSTQSIAPQFAGTISGFSQTAMFGAGIVCPYVTGALTKHSTPEEWKHAIYVAAALSFLGATIFIIFGSAELQPWAKIPAGDRVSPVDTELSEPEVQPRRRSSIFIMDSTQLAYERSRLPSLVDNT